MNSVCVSFKRAFLFHKVLNYNFKYQKSHSLKGFSGMATFILTVLQIQNQNKMLILVELKISVSSSNYCANFHVSL